MTRARLSSPAQPLLVRVPLRIYEFLASPLFAMGIIGLYALVLAYATFVESYYGDKSRAVNWAIYQSWWFALLNLLLGLSVLCAALIRFPWKRVHTGFLATHTGILLILLGSLLSHLGGIDATLSIPEGKSQWRALEDSQHFRLAVEPASPGRSDDSPRREKPTIVRVPFVSGPFNWDDYASLAWFPWRLAQRDRGLLYEQDGVRLEVLDYYSDSTEIPVPRVTLRVAGRTGDGMLGAPRDRVELEIQKPGGPHMGMSRFGMGQRKRLEQGQRLVFWMTSDPGETRFLRQSLPEGPLGPLGQIVLQAGGKLFRFAVHELKPGQRQPLGDTGLEMEFQRLEAQFLGVLLQIHHGTQAPQRMVLLADHPELTRQDYPDQVFGAYWIDAVAPREGARDVLSAETLREAAQPRIDLFQGADQHLYCRAWRSPKADPVAAMPVDGTAKTFWPGTPDQVTLSVDRFLASAEPGTAVFPVKFLRDKHPSQKAARARVRLTVDGRSEEFWLSRMSDGYWMAGASADAENLPLGPDLRRVVESPARRVSVSLVPDDVDVGFYVRLVRFNRYLDPGSGMASHYSSLVDFLDRQNEDRVLRHDVLITLNEPVSFSDPETGRSFRLYQSSFTGPFTPGDPQFEQIVAGGDLRDQLFISHLSANYDPGRGWKYAGSLLIVVGSIFTFYMKGFFSRKKDHAA